MDGKSNTFTRSLLQYLKCVIFSLLLQILLQALPATLIFLTWVRMVTPETQHFGPVKIFQREIENK